MRKLLLSLFLASAAAAPAFAQDDTDRAARQQARAERQAAREEARSERQSDRQSDGQNERAARADRVERMQVIDQQVDGNAYSSSRARARANAGAPGGDIDQLRARHEANEAAREERLQQRQDLREQIQADRELRQSTRPVPGVFKPPVPVVSNQPRAGTQPPLRLEKRNRPAPNWSANWRHNGKYDWKKHRNRYRWLYHLGFYNDPYGWGYYPYQIGWRLWPGYYNNRFWLNDPWQYRLPYAPAGYRWIRYYDDALLIDTWTGEVVDVIYNFFW